MDHDHLAKNDLVTSKQTDEKFKNGEQFTVLSIEKEIRILNDVPACIHKFRTLSVDGSAISFAETEKVAFVPDDERQLEKLASRVRDFYQKGKLTNIQAVRILEWTEQFNNFGLSALATVHKCQGRTVDTVFVDTQTVLKKPCWLSPSDHKRLLYTAITRAKKKVVFYEMKEFCIEDKKKFSSFELDTNPPEYKIAC